MSKRLRHITSRKYLKILVKSVQNASSMTLCLRTRKCLHNSLMTKAWPSRLVCTCHRVQCTNTDYDVSIEQAAQSKAKLVRPKLLSTLVVTRVNPFVNYTQTVCKILVLAIGCIKYSSLQISALYLTRIIHLHAWSWMNTLDTTKKTPR